jgi:hypothetical protein
MAAQRCAKVAATRHRTDRHATLHEDYGHTTPLEDYGRATLLEDYGYTTSLKDDSHATPCEDKHRAKMLAVLRHAAPAPHQGVQPPRDAPRRRRKYVANWCWECRCSLIMYYNEGLLE